MRRFLYVDKPAATKFRTNLSGFGLNFGFGLEDEACAGKQEAVLRIMHSLQTMHEHPVVWGF
jgi:hypothetical protein